MHSSSFFGLLVCISYVSANPLNVFERSVLNGACTGAGNAPGVCIATSDCKSAGGTYISDKCPGTPENIKCCTKAACGSGGTCKWTDQCKTNTVSNLCPGPANFKCCVPKSGGSGGGSGGGSSGGFPAPKFPSPSSGCKATAINGAKKIVAQFPGKIREIGCIRDCKCGSDSDHCCGMANDLMCSSKGGVKTESGKEIAEWIMNHHSDLKLKYGMWGQKIWSTSRDKVKPWSQWRDQSPKDRGDNTANHWDHVHVSYT